MDRGAMAKRSRVELFEQIRKVHEREDVSVRELARRFRVHRRTVREALASAVPPARKGPPPRPSVLDPWKPLIVGWLEADSTAQAAAYRPAGVAAAGR